MAIKTNRTSLEIISEVTEPQPSPQLSVRPATIGPTTDRPSKWKSPSEICEEISGAVRRGAVEEVDGILQDMEQQRKAWLLNNSVVDKKPVLNWAASIGNIDMVIKLLENGINPALIPRREPENNVRTSISGESETVAILGTALHDAIRHNQLDAVRAILNTIVSKKEGSLIECRRDSKLAESLSRAQVLVNIKDAAGLTPLLALADTTSHTKDQFLLYIEILCKNGADPNARNPQNGRSLIYKAVELGTESACKLLIDAGADINVVDDQQDTPLHVAARLDHTDIVKLIVQTSGKSVNGQNKEGKTALHYVGEKGCQDCITFLLNKGADLSLHDSLHNTALELIFSNLPRPNNFFYSMLNSKIMPNQYGINNRRFQLHIDFSILSPNSAKQMSVVVAIMKSLRSPDRKRMFSHPLIETYIRAKWIRLRVFFFGLWLLHLLFVSSLSAHVISTITDIDHVVWTRRVLLTSAVLLLLHKTCEIYLAPRYFLKESETWLTALCIAGSFIVAMSGELRPVALTAAASEDQQEETWTRHIAAYAILLAWIQLIMILGRFPTFGIFALMFFTILKNILKVLVVFYCLVIGFAISFFIQNNLLWQGEGVFSSVIRTTVMLVGEYQFDQFFPDELTAEEVKRCPGLRDLPRWQEKHTNLGVTTQLIFLLFIFLGSIVLVNLMIGLAVSDIQGLREHGLMRHMMKQAEFLLETESILSRLQLFGERKQIPTKVTISPNCGRTQARQESRRLRLSIPSHVMENLIKIALQNREGTATRPNSNIASCDNSDVDFNGFLHL